LCAYRFAPRMARALLGQRLVPQPAQLVSTAPKLALLRVLAAKREAVGLDAGHAWLRSRTALRARRDGPCAEARTKE